MSRTIMKHAYIVLSPLNPLLYSKTGVYSGIVFFSFQKHKLWVLVRTASNEYTQSMF